MRLLNVLFLLFQGLQVKVLGSSSVSGYVGETVTLPSKADKSWNLSIIDWSIFSNNTWIATYNNDKISTGHSLEYEGRLTLDTKSGDLTIRNLRHSDAREYTVDLLNSKNENQENKIRLIVKQHLQKPDIHQLQLFTANGKGCVLVLNCSSPDDGVDFSWDVEPSCHHCSSKSWNGTSELYAFFQTTPDSVNATCTARHQMENASNNLISKIEGPVKPPQPNHSCGYMFFWGFVIATLLLIAGFLLYRFRGKIREALQRCIDPQMSPSKD